MFSYIWPIALVVLSNTLYQICAKSVPEGMNPLASLTITYLIGTVVSCVLYYILNRNANLIREVILVNEKICQITGEQPDMRVVI